MPDLVQMLHFARHELTAMMDLTYFLLMNNEEAQKQFAAWQENTAPQKPEAPPQCAPFVKQRLTFSIPERQGLLQEAYDFAAHVHSLKQTLT